MYWAQALAEQTEDADLQQKFTKVHQAMKSNAAAIIQELNEVQKKPVDMGGYYKPDPAKAEKAMRPCTLWNNLLDQAAKDVL